MKKEITPKSQLIIPCHWNKEIIDQILINNQGKDIQVKEIYGVLADGGPVGHGRAKNAVINVSRKEAIDFRQYLGSKGLNFIYLLNAPFSFDGNQEKKQKLDQYLDWILEEFRPTALMISSHELMQYVRLRDKQIPIHISTIAGVKSVDDLKLFLDIKPSRVIAHHDLGKDWQALKSLVRFCQQQNIKVELMVTESCLFRCPKRDAHYRYLAQGNQDAPFHTTCNAQKIIHPREFLLAGSVIRPEDVCLFEEMGINHFKITGRSKPAQWLPEVVTAYQEKQYKGNLIRLLGIDPSIRAEDWIYLDNQSLDGFLASFPYDQDYRQKVTYCEQWIERLYKNEKFELRDGSSYQQKKKNLILVGEGGSRAKIIIGRERDKKVIKSN